ncbi:uncharacterized protein BKA78DRAFT_292959 [Phyllosticta capitalensis]|uniref:uncharacterized protein n=1 Tax=Phyllosticta capitalensis TaxID=121624 RepID=UPI00312CFD17
MGRSPLILKMVCFQWIISCSFRLWDHELLKAYLDDLGGYPELALFLSKPENMGFRRFKYLRTRLILCQQFKLAQLEKELRSLDQKDYPDNVDWLFSLSNDKNDERKCVLAKIKDAFVEYDALIQQTAWVMSTPIPTQRNRERMQNEASNLVGDESSILQRDLMYIGSSDDQKYGALYEFSEASARGYLKARANLQKIFGASKEQGTAEDTAEDTAVVYRETVRRIARAIAAVLSVVILLLPILILNFVHAAGSRLAVVFVSAAAFISAVTILTPIGTGEVFVAGATYAAVMVVFVSQAG